MSNNSQTAVAAYFNALNRPDWVIGSEPWVTVDFSGTAQFVVAAEHEGEEKP